MLFLPYCLIFFHQQVFSYFSLHFQRNLTNELSPDNLMENLFRNSILTNFFIGTPKQEIKMSIKLQNNLLYVFTSELTSKTFSPIKSKSFFQKTNFSNMLSDDNNNSFLSTDIISLSNNKKNNFNFLLIKNYTKFENIEGGILGLNINSNEKIKDINFINQLKKLNLISSYSFSIKFKNENEGDLIIGKRPDEYDNKYQYNYFHSTNLPLNNNELDWGLLFDKIEYNEENLNEGNKYFSYFEPELGVIVSNFDFKILIEKLFFNNYVKEKKCFFKRFEGDIKYTGYKYYYCNEDVDISTMNNLTFYSKELNFTFILTYKDLFYNFQGNNYYLVVFPWYSGLHWRLGLPFFKKYQLVFDTDKKMIGIYEKILDKNYFLLISWKNNLIIFLSTIIVFLIFYIYKNFVNKPRKMRANELKDNYEYIPELIDYKLC